MSWESPETWKVVTLADVCYRIVDGSHNPPTGQSSGSPMLSAKNIQNGKIRFDELRLLSPDDFELENKRTNISAGDVLLTIVGALGRTAVVSETDPEFTLQRSVAVLKSDFINPNYLRYLLDSPVAQKFFVDNAKGTAQKGIYLKPLGGMHVPIAPLAEQNRIAEKLDGLLSQVDIIKTRVDGIPDLLRRFRQSVLAAAISGRLTEEWRSIVGIEEPQVCWRSAKLGELCTLVTSGSRGWAGYYSDSGAIFIRSQDISTDELDITDTAFVKLPESSEGKRTKVQTQDLLVTITGANVGKVARVKQQLSDAYVSQHVALVRLNKPEYSAFIELYLKDISSGRGELTNLAYGGGKPGLNLSNIRDLALLIPPIDEQVEIVRRVKQLFNFADQLEDSIARALFRIDHLNLSLLVKAFSGKLTADWRTANPDLISGRNSAEALLEEIKSSRETKQKKQKSGNQF